MALSAKAIGLENLKKIKNYLEKSIYLTLLHAFYHLIVAPYLNNAENPDPRNNFKTSDQTGNRNSGSLQ